MKKIFITIVLILAVILLAGIALLWDTKKKIDSGEMVKWEGQWYSKAQIKEKYGEQYYNTPAKNTPEEVYTTFRDALLAGDTEKALLQMRPERREEYRKAFNEKTTLNNYLTIPSVENIIKSEKESIGNFASYYYKENNKKIFTIEFTKNIQGYWQIDII